MTEPNHALAVYPGSFDPVTLGHEDIVRRALGFADRVLIAIAHHRTQPKPGLFTIAERLELIRTVYRDEPRVEVAQFDGLLVDFARGNGAKLIIRGLRAMSDFEYEFQMALMNRRLEPSLETVFLASDVQHTFLSASLVREIAGLGGDVSGFVSPIVLETLARKLDRPG